MKTQLTCQNCGVKFYPISGSLKQKTCSTKCGHEYRINHGGTKKGRHYPYLQRARIGKCIICGNAYRAVKDFKLRKQKFCSKKCWNIRAKVINHCRYCGKEIRTVKSSNKQYCDQNCRNIDFRIRFVGENSHLWKGGRTEKNKLIRTCARYAEWRKAVFIRDGYTCKKCKAKSESDKKVYLNAHHIKPVAMFPELAYEVDNGITLCDKCHKKEHKHKF